MEVRQTDRQTDIHKEKQANSQTAKSRERTVGEKIELGARIYLKKEVEQLYTIRKGAIGREEHGRERNRGKKRGEREYTGQRREVEKRGQGHRIGNYSKR